MQKDYQKISQEIIEQFGGIQNIESYTNCMTRLHVCPLDQSLINLETLKKIDSVIDVVVIQGVYQVILGPGIVQTVRKEVDILFDITKKSNPKNSKDPLSKHFIKMMQAIIMPAIGTLIAIALINSIINICKIAGVDPVDHFILNALAILGTVGTMALGLLFAVNTAKFFKGNMYITILLAVFLINPGIDQISIFGFILQPGIGGAIAMILLGVIVSFTERAITSYIPNALKLIVTPLLTMLISLLILLFIIIPISTVLTIILIQIFTFIVDSSPITFIIGSALLAAAYPFLVLSGLHVSIFFVLIPIYMETGSMPLIASAFLGGAAQIGTATAVYYKERKYNHQIKEIWVSGVTVGFLGVIEPLMYGINLPRFKPLVIASAVAFFGGIAVALCNLTMGYALSGLLGVLSFSTLSDMIMYGIIWLSMVFFGFIACMIFYKPNK